MSRAPTTSGTYVYCITEGQALALAPATHPARDVYLVADRELAAVASKVPWNEFGARALRHHLQDASWLEQEARAHEHVIEQVMVDRPVLPMKFCTIFRSDRRVRAMLAAHPAELHRALAQLREKQEWEVKMYLSSPPPAAGAAASPLSGKEYLLMRRAQQLRAVELSQAIDLHARGIFENLASHADRIQLKPIAPPATPAGRRLVFDAVCLLARPRLDAFEHHVRRMERELEAAGLHFELSGPWPPYHFAAEALGNVSLL